MLPAPPKHIQAMNSKMNSYEPNVDPSRYSHEAAVRPIEAGAWSDEQAEQAKESIRKSRENWR